MDITTDGFGFMLAAGDLLWVPFTYSLQARYLAFEHVELGPVGGAIVVVVALTGYWIFRGANGEKNDFRNGRNPKSRFFCVVVGPGLIRLPQISLIWRRSEEPNFSPLVGGGDRDIPTTCSSFRPLVSLPFC